MASLNLSANGPSISKSYQSVVNAAPPQEWLTYLWPMGGLLRLNSAAQVVSSPHSATSPDFTTHYLSEGELVDLIEEFSEGRVQFAYVKVTDPNTGLPKNVLIAWCGEGVPERTKGYFTSHLASVSKFLHGYHVQITARADGHLSPEGIVQRVADSSGAKYSAESQAPPSSTATRPPVASKPVFTPTRSGGIAPAPAPALRPKPSAVDNDGWGDDAPPVTRTQLEKVQPAYKPTKVNLQQLKSENQSPASRQPISAPVEERANVVRGAYQPIGKVDIAAIRRQAAESGNLKDDRPAPVKGSYEPVGKVDIAAIRARAQKPEGEESPAPRPVPRNEPTSLPERPAAANQSAERLTNLPKPKVANRFGSVGSASRTFADQGGKTPSQLWAERKAKERGGTAPAADAPPSLPIQSQPSGQNEWKSGYKGKSWAPVQTVEDKHVPEAADVKASDVHEPEPVQPASHIQDVRDQFSHPPAEPESHFEPEPEPVAIQAPPPPPVPQASRPIPVPGIPEPEDEFEAEPEPEVHQDLPPPPPQPRSPTPPTPPVRESSPIRVAIPVSREVADAHDEQHAPPPAMPIESLQEAIPDERDLEDETHDLGRAAAEATVPDQSQGGFRAVVQYDYEKAEDNEIELREGELVTDIEMVDEDWWLGVNVHGERGLFPGNYVEIVEEGEAAPHVQEHVPEPEPEPVYEPEPVAAPIPAAPEHHAADSHGPTALAVYDYEAAEDNELSFPEGATILNVEFPDDDWWLGEYHGARGLFPANYVQLNE
ncbi:uncharacterized protein N7483_012877 [Penicillium malachiteum]|uniref:uncharacterized protein n=1 Tax=Penicillium malachiteum TaxID=1324776 RepID=UPI002548CA8C|nr:uncharacterized protein N7483_012877 [Penicillium malachiteum]KAJ5715696.1 hypothetical protein N7483_012877 [Penicillium malachiteum]